jgi:hypothetical protein
MHSLTGDGEENLLGLSMIAIEQDKVLELGAAITANQGGQLRKFLLDTIDRNVQVSIERYRGDPTARVGELLGLDEGQDKKLWGLDLSSVRELKGPYSTDVKMNSRACTDNMHIHRSA